MDRNKEISEIEKLIKFSDEFKLIDETSIFNYKRIMYLYKNIGNLNYFKFIAKTNRYNSKDFFELAIELKGIEKSYHLKNFIFGSSLFYFMMIFDRQPKYFGLKTIGKFFIVSSLILYQNLNNQLLYTRLMREIYYPELINMKDKLEKDSNGWEPEINLQLTENLELIRKEMNQTIEDKYEIKDSNKVLKPEFMSIEYNQSEKSNILNLLNFASEWLYAPADQELENKLYFSDYKTKEDIQLQNKITTIIKDGLSISKKDYDRNCDLEDILLEDLENILKDNVANGDGNIIKRYGLRINEKV